MSYIFIWIFIFTSFRTQTKEHPFTACDSFLYILNTAMFLLKLKNHFQADNIGQLIVMKCFEFQFSL